MKRYPRYLTVLFLALFFCLAPLALGQAGSSSSPFSFKPGLRFDYFSRTISWDDNQATSELTSYFGSLVLEFEFGPRFSLAALIGYSSSNLDGLIFRHLPVSIDFNGGGMTGIILGGEIKASLVSGGGFDIAAFGQLLADLGSRKEWTIPGLVVSGTTAGTPTWMRASVGPLFTYKGWKDFSPYLFPSFDYLRGTFEMKETIQSLEGNEKKEIKGKSLFGIALGADFAATPKFTIKAEAGAYPYSGGLDYAVMLKALFSL
jgi:hypothetical protein